MTCSCSILQQGRPWVALDTESDSLFRYTPRVCLIQISTPAGTAASESNSVAMRHGAAGPDAVVDYLIDPLQLRELSELGEILENDTTEVILHAAENDILTLQCDFDFRLHRIFDTQLAARILGRPRAWVLRRYCRRSSMSSATSACSARTGGSARSRRSRWPTRRWTHIIFPRCAARQVDRLRAADRWEEAQHAFLMFGEGRICAARAAYILADEADQDGGRGRLGRPADGVELAGAAGKAHRTATVQSSGGECAGGAGA